MLGFFRVAFRSGYFEYSNLFNQNVTLVSFSFTFFFFLNKN